MLKSLSIRNVILIDKLDLDFADGFTILSGETGAGKSILLDSLGLILGQRADVAMIRSGCDKLAVCGVFECTDKSGLLAKLCAEHDLDYDGEVIINRTLTADGRGKIFFNDQPITQRLLKEIAAFLVEIHGQFDNQGLLDANTHLAVLDAYGHNEKALDELKKLYLQYKNAQKQRISAEQNLEKAQLEEDNLRHWVKEFANINPLENETEELEKKRRLMMNAEKLAENFNAAYKALNASMQGVNGCLRQAEAAVARVNGLTEDKYADIYNMLDTALVNVNEANAEIENALNEIDVNQNEANNIEERLFTLKDLARKHHVAPEDLPAIRKELETKLQTLEKGADDLQSLRDLEQQAFDEYAKQADVVHQMRVSVAADLDKNMQKELPALKLEKARFMTRIEPKNKENWNEYGYDDVCFMVSTNPGNPYGSLSKIASGGELSRFMLALKVNLGQTGNVETMIFDEIDAGIGGATAQAVGAKLAELGKNKQVLVVTHSPQVAAFSTNHFKVEKICDNSTTITTVRQLNAAQKQEEIARMLSGEVISDEARATAKVLMGA